MPEHRIPMKSGNTEHLDMKTYRAVLIGCSRMGAFIDNEAAYDFAYSHAAGYEACARTELVACSDLREQVMAQAGKRYGIPRDKQYVDYREMFTRERPDIVSVATQPEQRARVVIDAAESGARAIYAEKAMAASMVQSESMVRSVQRHGVFFNLGTNRRWDAGYDEMYEIIHGGRLGALKTLINHGIGTLFNMGSHGFDLLLRLNGDNPVRWVQAHLTGDDAIDGDILRADPTGNGVLRFENGVTAYALNTGRGIEVEAICENGVVTSICDGDQWNLRERTGTDQRGRPALVDAAFPSFVRTSSTVNVILDLVHALDTGEPTRGGVRVAHAGMELIFAFIASHQRGGALVELPLTGSRLRLDHGSEPHEPRYERRA